MLSPDSGGRGNKVPTQAIPWVNLENARLSEELTKDHMLQKCPEQANLETDSILVLV